MDPDLHGKRELFRQLDGLKQVDDDDEVIDADEIRHRAKCKAFAKSALPGPVVKSRSTFSGIGNPPGAAPRRTASDPIATRVKTTEVIVIDDTPQAARVVPGQTRLSSLLQAASSMDDTSIPDSTKRHSAQPVRRDSNTRLRKRTRSSPPAEDSPSTSMAKRKRSLTLKMAPEGQQCFKGLSFFFIPNDDVNPVRGRRITRAREHGANWVRSLDDASHVVVDANFTYADIEKTLDAHPEAKKKIIVNEGYPIDCIIYRRLLNPDQPKYQVPGFSQSVAESRQAPGPSQESERSLQLKPDASRRLRKGQPVATGTPPRSDESTQRSTQISSGNVITVSQLGSQAANITTGAARLDGSTGPRASQNHHGDLAGAPVVDELSQLINFVKSNPNADIGVASDDDDVLENRPSSSDSAIFANCTGSQRSDDGSASSGKDRKRKRKGPSRKTSKDDPNWQDKFACMKGGSKDGKDDNPNADTIAILQDMCDYYTGQNDTWRIKAYRQAISALRQQSTRITTSQEAKDIAGIGERLADKIEEIVNTGRLKRLEAALQEPDHEVRELFLKIYDVGLERAQKWIQQGYRTLEDLLEKANLTRNQRIGIEHYEDLNTRIPRAEVEALGKCVRRAAADIDSRVELLIGGSYRRGSDTSGDIDFIITKKGTSSSSELTPFLDRLVDKLTSSGFLTVGLATSRSSGGSKWHGCCVLPKADFPGDKADYKPIWRRIDLLLVPETEFGAALIYFTGNDLFNRSMRWLAHKKGMRLNQRGLYRDVMRGPGGIKYNEGDLVEGRDEKKIFEALGVQWREPHQRWC
ncbi:hypothetical protein JX265_010215 [Neoarthrinium moseri]|uniref:DNA polymerase lambda n=1 Tax=Neoarthrinium moseri TaxID=1658444 RepID=A0A9P9WER3_9PEZI|nr:hypothetical protein JX265_010215 [Neoarthrinium moseri]